VALPLILNNVGANMSDFPFPSLTAAPMQHDRRKNPERVPYRRMTIAEIKALKPGDQPKVLLNNGRIGEVKINGAVKRWKREPDRVEVSVKYGLYETARYSTQEALARFIIIDQQGEQA
jgi:hypothetical protein